MATIIIAIYLGAAIGIAANLLVRPSRPIDNRGHSVEGNHQSGSVRTWPDA